MASANTTICEISWKWCCRKISEFLVESVIRSAIFKKIAVFLFWGLEPAFYKYVFVYLNEILGTYLKTFY